jgi:outer membrane protein, heavy metal efflux system
LRPYLRLWTFLLFAFLFCAEQKVHCQAPASPAPAGSAPMTMQQAVDYALAHNPTLLSAEQTVLSMKGQEVEAGLRQNPNLTLDGTDLSNPATAVTPYAYSLQLSRLFERGQKRRWRLDTARATTAQTTDQFHDQERGTVLAVKQAFTGMILAKYTLDITRDQLRNYRQQLEIYRAQYQDGNIGKIDFERLDLQLAEYESDETTAEMTLVQTGDQLQTLLGFDQPRRDFDIVGDLVPPPVTSGLTDLEQRALANRPDYKATQAGVDVADANVKMAYANGTTDPTLEGEYDHSGNLSSFGFFVSVPVRIFDRNQGNKDTSKYLAQGSRFTEVAARNQVYSDVDQAWIAYTTSKVLSDRYNGHYLAEAKDVLAIAQYAYQRGGLALLDYLNAMQDDRTTTLNALNSYAQTWMAIHQLSFTTASEVVP